MPGHHHRKADSSSTKPKSKGADRVSWNSHRPSYNELEDQYASGLSQRIECKESESLLISLTKKKKISEGNRKKYSTIQSLIGNPITSGYLLQFCKSEYNAESLSFVLDVDKLRDTFAADPENTWIYDWREIDKQVIKHEIANGQRSLLDIDHITDYGGLFCDDLMKEGCVLNDNKWPSVTDLPSAMITVDTIVEDWLNHDSDSQICISNKIIKRTRKRIELFHLYGPEVFEEACLEPIKTMRKDILPRFLVSDIADRMFLNVDSCEPETPKASDLKVPPPDSRLLSHSSLELFSVHRKYNLDELVNCLQLYNEFHNFLKQCQSAENLICVRMIVIFEEHMSTLSLHMAGVQAWKIYQYFVAPGSAFEVSIDHMHRKHIMLDLAEPQKGMFENLRKSASEMLKVNFDTFAQVLKVHMNGYKFMLFGKTSHVKHFGSAQAGNSFGCFGGGSSKSSRK